MGKYDKIDLAQMQAQVEDMKKIKKYLAMHKNKIYEGSDGYWYTYLPGNRKRIKVKRKTEDEVIEKVAEFYEALENSPTIEDIFNEWIDKKLNKGKIKHSTYDRTKQVYNRHFGEFGQKKIIEVAPEDIQDFLEDELFDKQLTSKGFSSLKTVVKGILQCAKRRKVISFNIRDLFDDLDIDDRDYHKNVKEDCEEVFDEEETRRIMEYCRNNLDLRNAGVLLLFVTGLRVGELVSLKNEDISDYGISVRRTETKYKNPDGPGYLYEVKDFPKTEAGIRNVVLPKDYQFVLKRLKLFNPFEEYVFVENGKRLKTAMIRRRLWKICDTLNIPRRSPHKIRKTVTSILLDAKLDNNLIRSQLGWTDISVGENFYHRNRKTVDKKIRILSSIDEFCL